MENYRHTRRPDVNARAHDPTLEPPRDRRVIARLGDDIVALAELGRQVHHVLATYRDWSARGYPATTGNETVNGGSTPSAPLGAFTKNPAGVAYEHIHDDLDRIHYAIENLKAKAHMAIDPPTESLGLPGCRSCRRIQDHDHRVCGVHPDHSVQQWWTPVYVVCDQLCRWCWEFSRDWKVLPPTEVLEARRDGRKITTRLIRQHLEVA